MKLRGFNKEVVSTVKTCMSFDDLYDKAVQIQDQCSDYEIAGSKIMFGISQESHRPFITFTDEESGNLVKLLLTKHSLSQLCLKLGIPAYYIEKCYRDGKMYDLAERNVNEWLSAYYKPLLVRSYSNYSRGIVSNRFMTLDTPDILTTLDSVIDSEQYGIKGYFLSPERFHARIVQKQLMNVSGEDLYAGIQVDSSDVGRSILSVKFFIYKQVCTNGLSITKAGGVLFKQRHFGSNLNDFRVAFEESLNNLPELVVAAEWNIKNAIRDKIDLVSSNPDSSEVQDFILNIQNTTGLRESSSRKVYDLMREKYSLSRWGFINAVTEVAQNFTLERRIELEQGMGNLLIA